MDLTKIDYKKPSTEFSKELERMRAIMFLELQLSIQPRGFINRIFHALARKTFIQWS